MITHLKRAQLFAPTALGQRDLWVSAGKIIALGAELPEPPEALLAERIDLGGARVTPGLVDLHAHLTGGGGEDGPMTRAPRLPLSALSRAGVTTVVGVLGTDCSTRTMRDLVATAYGLRGEGLKAWCYTGGYPVPPSTLTGSVRDDIAFIDPVIGVGELAISDHRSSQPTLDELLRIASDAYVAGKISGKSGLVHLHLGDGPRGLELIRRALDQSELPGRVFHPTHVNRRPELFAEAIELAGRGVPMDVTAFPEEGESFSAAKAILRWIDSEAPDELLSCSSDGGGCLPAFNERGDMVSMGIGSPSSLLETLRELLLAGVGLDRALPFFTTNPARIAGLNAGRVHLGGDADLLILDDEGQLDSVMASGRWLLRRGQPTQLGTFESE